MADRELENSGENTTEQNQETEESSGQQSVNLNDLPQFREYQSKQDRRIAELQKQNRRLQESVEELIDDPEAKREFKLNRLQTELQQYKQQEQISRQRQQLAEKWGVPENVLQGISDPSEMTSAALDYLNSKTKEFEERLSKQEKEEELESIEEEGGHDVSTTQSSPPDQERVSNDEIDERIDELREVSRGRGTRAQQARVEIFKLQAQKNVTRNREAQL